MSVYDYSANLLNGEEKSLSDYKGKVLLIVNTASKCGFTPQYKELEQLYQEYHALGFEVLAFPCNQFMNQEPGTNEEIQQFCQLNYGVSFPIFSKIYVNGADTHPLFTYLKKEAGGVLFKNIKWNFTKFLVDRDGSVVKRYAPATTPLKLENDIKELIEMN